MPSIGLIEYLDHRTTPGGVPPNPRDEVPPGIGALSLHHFFHKAVTMPVPRNRNIRAVTEADIPVETPRPKSITEAAASGSQRELLVSLRTRVAEAVQDPNCPPRDLAALSRRLQELSKEIAAIDAREEADDANGSDEGEDGDFDASAV